MEGDKQYDTDFIVFSGSFIVYSFHCQITRLQNAVQHIKQNIKDTKLLNDLEVRVEKKI